MTLELADLDLDENVNPFMTLDILQVEGLKAWQIDEICS
jgi:hypothetical protein